MEDKCFDRKRNYSLDFLKGIAAIFVVFIHAVFPNAFGKYIAEIGCFAVPVFFLTSGYFNASASREKTKKSIKHIVSLIAITYFLNVLRIFVVNGFSIINTLVYLQNIVVDIKNIAMWLLLNVTRISGVARFLFALLYCYILRYFFYNIFEKRIIYLVMLLGFAGGIAVKLIFPLLGIGFNGVNNVWFKGLPFFLCGRLLREKRDFFTGMKYTSILVGTALIGYMLISVGFYANNGLGYIGMVFLSISLFILCIVYPGNELVKENKLWSLICQMGSTYSFFIYIGHPLVMHAFDAVVNVSGMLLWFRPIIILVCTVVFASFYYMVKNKIRSMT